MDEDLAYLISLGFTDRMGPQLRAEVTRQLLEDFHYCTHESIDHLTIDWSDTCPEGHNTKYLDGWLENWSGVRVVNAQGEFVAEGWLEFIHGDGDYPLFVYWEYLRPGEGEEVEEVAHAKGIPYYIWDKFSDSMKDLCLNRYVFEVRRQMDSRLHNDPLIITWGKQKSVL